MTWRWMLHNARCSLIVHTNIWTKYFKKIIKKKDKHDREKIFYMHVISWRFHFYLTDILMLIMSKIIGILLKPESSDCLIDFLCTYIYANFTYINKNWLYLRSIVELSILLFSYEISFQRHIDIYILHYIRGQEIKKTMQCLETVLNTDIPSANDNL